MIALIPYRPKIQYGGLCKLPRMSILKCIDTFMDWGHDKWVCLRIQENCYKLDLGQTSIPGSHLPPL